MLGTTTVKFRIPGTVEGIDHEVMVADHGAAPNHVHILGNDFLKKVRATVGFEDQLLRGKTLAGEEFSVLPSHGGATQQKQKSQTSQEMIWLNLVQPY